MVETIHADGLGEHFDNWQWVVYFVANWVTAAAYFAIPLKLRFLRVNGLPTFSDAILYEMFIIACGVHHLVHPPAMLFDLPYPMMISDSLMAGISALAALVITDVRKLAADR